MMTIPTALAVKLSRYKSAAEGSEKRAACQSRNAPYVCGKRNPETATAASNNPQRMASRIDLGALSAIRFAPPKNPTSSNIQVHDFERIVLNELAARLDVFTHQRRENIFRCHRIFQFHLQQRARVRVHRRFPELRGIHFAEALEPRDGEIFLRVFHH